MVALGVHTRQLLKGKLAEAILEVGDLGLPAFWENLSDLAEAFRKVSGQVLRSGLISKGELTEAI